MTTLGHVMCAGLYAMLHVGFIIPLIVSGILQLTALILILTLAYTSSLALLITTIVFAGFADACMTAAVFGKQFSHFKTNLDLYSDFSLVCVTDC